MAKRFDKTFVYLVGAARKIWRWSKERKDAKERAKVSKDLYRCEFCKADTEKVEIDHINPVGITPRFWKGWDEYYSRLFCSSSNLQALCHGCHKAKTAKERGRKCKLKGIASAIK